MAKSPLTMTAAKLGLCSVLMAFGQGGPLSCRTYYDTGPRGLVQTPPPLIKSLLHPARGLKTYSNLDSQNITLL